MTARIGLLGGTFDPIHLGHLAAGRAAQAALGLDEVRLVPAHVPPHRPVGPRASAFHRFAMAALVALDEPGWTASDLELQRNGPSFTFDTLTELHRAGLSASQLFFIVGADAFAEIATWSRYPEVLDLTHFVVVTRPGTSFDGMTTRLPHVAVRVRTSATLTTSPATGVVFVPAPTPSVSSTDIRQRAAEGRSLDNLVTAPVAAVHSTPRAVSLDFNGGRCFAWRRAGRKRTPGRPRVPAAVLSVVDAMQQKKAEDVVALDLRQADAFTDFFLVCTGQNRRQVQAIADSVETALKARKQRPTHVEGYDRGEWVLLDYFDFVVHVFSPNARAFYGLERLWGNAIRMALPEPTPPSTAVS